MAEHNELGVRGEKLAKNLLIKKGYHILKTNYRFRHMEVDIIAKWEGILVVVEVKTRQSAFLAGPEITVTQAKQRAIIKVANAYILDNQWDGETRFDIVSVLVSKGTIQLSHLKDAFYPF